MSRAGRGGGGFRSGGGRAGGSRAGSGRIGGVSTGGRAGRGIGGVGRAPIGSNRSVIGGGNRGGFGTGFGMGMGAGMMMGGRRNGWGGGFGNRGFNGGFRGGHGFRRGSSLDGIILIAVFVIFAIVIFSQTGAIGGLRNITVSLSTIQREALPRNSAADIVPMFTDQAGWIRNENRLLPGLRDFHNRTGVRPHLFITDNINGNTALPNIETMSAFANAIYDSFFVDEAHVLLLFFENTQGQRAMYVTAGRQAQTVMDSEARNILMDFVERYYYSNVDEETLFSNAFAGAGQRIMSVTRSPWIPVFMVFGVLVVLVVLFIWWRKYQTQKNLEAEQTERMLAQNLDTFGEEGNDEASKLAEQYKE